MKTRNKVNLPINFCTTGNFLNLKQIKFVPTDNPPKIKNSKHKLINLQNKNSYTNLSEFQTNKKVEISQKDELIQKLQQKIKYLEKKIKILEKNTSSKSNSKNRSRNISLSNAFLLRTEKSTTNKKNKIRSINTTITKIIPLDKQLLKTKLNKKKKNLFELIDINKLKSIKKNKIKNNSFCNNNNSIFNNTPNHTTFTYTTNNSCIGSASKPKKKTIKLDVRNGEINSFHNLLYCINSNKNSKNKISREKRIINNKSNIVNRIPKKSRINQNTPTIKIMMSSTNYTNYSNNVSNSFKDETNNTNNANGAVITNTSFNDIQSKLENIKNRTKNLFEIFYNLHNLNKNKKDEINKDTAKRTNFPYNIKINKLEKIKK